MGNLTFKRPTDALDRVKETYAAVSKLQQDAYNAMVEKQQSALNQLVQAGLIRQIGTGSPPVQVPTEAVVSTLALPNTSIKAKLPNILGPIVRTVWVFITIVISIYMFWLVASLAQKTPDAGTDNAGTAAIALVAGTGLLVLLFSYFALMGYGDVEVVIGAANANANNGGGAG